MGTSSAEELGSISGNRWLDLSLSIIFACLFPVLRNLLGKYVYQVRWAGCRRCHSRSQTQF